MNCSSLNVQFCVHSFDESLILYVAISQIPMLTTEGFSGLKRPMSSGEYATEYVLLYGSVWRNS